MKITADSIGIYHEADEEYTKGLRRVEDDAIALRDYLHDWVYLAPDAVAAMPSGPEAWDRWRSAFPAVRRINGHVEEAWVREFGAILMPELLIRITQIKEQFKVPWGLAFHRAKDEGYITERDGAAYWAEPKAKGAKR